MDRILATTLVASLLLPCGMAAQSSSPNAVQPTQAVPAKGGRAAATKSMMPPIALPAVAPLPGPGSADPAVAPGFVIGPEDVLGVLFWRDAEMSGDVTVRPDGMITLPLIGDIRAAGLTPSQLATRIGEAVHEYITDPSVTVVVRQMNSWKVFITGEVAKPGAYRVGSQSMTVMQLIALAGGLTEWAAGGRITVVRTEEGRTRTYAFDYTGLAKGKRPEQNLVLRPGDTVIVPER